MQSEVLSLSDEHSDWDEALKLLVQIITCNCGAKRMHIPNSRVQVPTISWAKQNIEPEKAEILFSRYLCVSPSLTRRNTCAWWQRCLGLFNACLEPETSEWLFALTAIRLRSGHGTHQIVTFVRKQQCTIGSLELINSSAAFFEKRLYLLLFVAF